MLRLTIFSAALLGVQAANHSGNASGNATAGNATAAPTTAAPTTAAPTTAAATTAAATTGAPKTSAPKKTDAPKTHPPTTVDPRAGCGNDTTSANCTTTAAPVIKEKRIETTIAVTMKLDITNFSTEEKAAVGNGVAYGIHDAACEGVKTMWTTKGKCLLGQSKHEGVNFGMAMNIDSNLVSNQPGCTSADCYGEPAPARQLAETTLTNSGDFAVVVQAAALQAAAAGTGVDFVAAAKTSINTAKASGALAPAAVASTLTQAMNRTSVTSKVSGTKLTNLVAAATAAVATVSAPVEKVVTQAPVVPVVGTTSNAFTAGAASALMLMAGALLF